LRRGFSAPAGWLAGGGAVVFPEAPAGCPRQKEETMLKTPSVPALERGLSVLELISASRKGLTLPELTRRLALPRSSLYAILLTMERRGYIERSSASGRYTLGAKFLTLANVSSAATPLLDQATSILHDTVTQTGLTAHLAVIAEDQAALVARVTPPFEPGPSTWIGKRMNLHCTAIGKVLLAYLPAEELERLMRNRRLSRFNDNTITSPAKLNGELDQIRRAGCASEDEEEEIGYRCVAAPIRGDSGAVVAALSLSGTTDQITPSNITQRIQAVKHAAELISARLGAAAAGWDEGLGESAEDKKGADRSIRPAPKTTVRKV
jgi:DNA-binding IclR family transcriptional regulator